MADDANGPVNAGTSAPSAASVASASGTAAPVTPSTEPASAANAGTKAPATSVQASVAKSEPAKVGDQSAKPATAAAATPDKPAAAEVKAPETQAKSPDASAPSPDDDKPITRRELNEEWTRREVAAQTQVAIKNHNTSLAAQVESLTSKVSDAFHGLPEPMRQPLIDSVLKKYDDARATAGYPQGHPLHGQVRGILDDAAIAALVQSAADLKSSIRAATLNQIGQGANMFRPGVAGNQAGQGAAAPAKKQSLTDYVGSAVDNVFASRGTR